MLDKDGLRKAWDGHLAHGFRRLVQQSGITFMGKMPMPREATRFFGGYFFPPFAILVFTSV